MKTYEMIHEISDMCRGKMDSDISEIQTDNLDEYMKKYITKVSEYSKADLDDGSVCYEVVTSGLKSKYTFTEI